MNTKLHAVTDANGRPLSFFMTTGQVSDDTGAAALLDDLLKAQWLLADRGYDADWYRDALQAKGITPCIPGRKSRLMPIKYGKRRYKSRNRIEIMFGRLKPVLSLSKGTGTASPPATIDVRPSSSPPSPSPPPPSPPQSSSGPDQRVLSLGCTF